MFSFPRLLNRMAAREWVKSLSFQIVVVPSALALVSTIVTDALDAPWRASMLTALVAVVAALGFWLGASNRSSALADGVVSSESFEVVVSAVSDNPRAFEDPKTSLLARVIAAYSPKRMVLVISPSADSNGNRQAAEELANESDVEASFVLLPERAIDKPATLTEIVKGYLGSETGRTVIDITGGNSVMSVGMFQAAIDRGVWAGYIKAQPNEPVTAHLVAEPNSGPEYHTL